LYFNGWSGDGGRGAAGVSVRAEAVEKMKGGGAIADTGDKGDQAVGEVVRTSSVGWL
jgi:hypothetical protein